MNDYIIFRKNPLGLPIGTRLELTDYGFEKVICRQVDGRSVGVGYYGIVYPTEALADYVVKICNEGFDERAFLKTYRRRTLEVKLTEEEASFDPEEFGYREPSREV